MPQNLGIQFAGNLQWTREDSGSIRLVGQGEQNGESISIVVLTFASAAFPEQDVKAWLQSVIDDME